MALAAWTSTETGPVCVVGWLRAAFVLLLVAAMVSFVVPGHVAHELGNHDAVVSAQVGDIEERNASSLESVTDCAQHPGCQGIILTAAALLPAVAAALLVLSASGRILPGILEPPLPHPPNHS
jgi:hypothetical protein